MILAVYPPEDDACRRFLASHELLARIGVSRPEILARSCSEGWMLLEDVGEKTWYEERVERPWPTCRPLYERAVDIALAFRKLPRGAVAALNPPLDASALENELRLTWDALLVPEGLAGTGAVATAFRDGLTALCERLGSERAVPAHRDFMVRNLVVRGRRLVVLDHQDVRLAPPAYDLASLFNDSLFPPADETREMALRALEADASSYRRAVVQRCLKAAGSYRRASGRGQSARDALIRPTLARAWAELRHLPELAAVHEDLSPVWARLVDLDGTG